MKTRVEEAKRFVAGLTEAGARELLENAVGDIFIHFKGDKYLLLGIAENATGRWDAVYKALYGECRLHTREVLEFFDIVHDRKDNPRGQVMRFEPICVTSEKERNNAK